MSHSIHLTITSPTESFSYTSTAKRVSIGRSEKCDMVVPLEDLSREHCLFEVEGEGLFITDLGSHNGIKVDGDTLPPRVRTRIKEDSAIVLARKYSLKINDFAAKGGPDLVAKGPGPVDLKLELPREKEKKTLPRKRAKVSTLQEEEKETPADPRNTKRMIVFTMIIASLLYLFLKK